MSECNDHPNLDPKYPGCINNMNVWGMYTQYQYMLEEMARSISKKNPGLLSHDATRWRSYIDRMRDEASYWQSQAFLDLPVTHGRQWEISDPLPINIDFKDSPAIAQLMALVTNARDELVTSGSAQLPMHLYPADLTRQETYWVAMEGYITHLEQRQPLDEPVTAAEENLGLMPGQIAEAEG